MRATVIAMALGAVVACKGKPAPKVYDAAVVAVTVQDAGPEVDAGRPWYALPIDASPDAKQFSAGQLPYLGGEWGAVELSAVDAPAGQIMAWLAADKQLLIALENNGVVRGYASSESLEKLTDVLHAALPNVIAAPVRNARGKGSPVDLSFARAPVRDLYRLLSDIDRKNYVLGPGTVLDVYLSAKRVPADVVAKTLAQVIGRGSPDVAGNVTYVRDPAGAALDEALIGLGGPTVNLDAKGARAGEVYAVLAKLGASIGGAACTDGEPFELRLRKVKAGVAAAVVAAMTGVVPGEAACAPAVADLAAAKTVTVIAGTDKRRVAVVDNGMLDSKDLAPDTIAESYITTGASTTIVMYPADLTSPYAGPTAPGSVPVWAPQVDKARLVATLLDNDRRFALLELPDGTFQELTNIGQDWYSDFQYTIGSGRLWYYLRQVGKTPLEGSLILQEK